MKPLIEFRDKYRDKLSAEDLADIILWHTDRIREVFDEILGFGEIVSRPNLKEDINKLKKEYFL